MQPMLDTNRHETPVLRAVQVLIVCNRLPPYVTVFVCSCVRACVSICVLAFHTHSESVLAYLHLCLCLYACLYNVCVCVCVCVCVHMHIECLLACVLARGAGAGWSWSRRLLQRMDSLKMMMFITISARDQSSEGTQRMVAVDVTKRLGVWIPCRRR